MELGGVRPQAERGWLVRILPKIFTFINKME